MLPTKGVRKSEKRERVRFTHQVYSAPIFQRVKNGRAKQQKQSEKPDKSKSQQLSAKQEKQPTGEE